ncbi:MAG: S8 family serine peptidase, partial [Verrucomicrobiota bacterium]
MPPLARSTSLFVFLLFLWLTNLLQAGPRLDDRIWQLQDGMKVGAFRIASDELQCFPGHGRDHAFAIETQPNGEAVSRRARALTMGSGDSRFRLVLYGKRGRTADRRILGNLIALHVRRGTDVAAVGKSFGAFRVRCVSKKANQWLLHFDHGYEALSRLEGIRATKGILRADVLLGKRRARRFELNDPLFQHTSDRKGYLWHLRNTGENGGLAGIDINVEKVWDRYRGNGLFVGIVDDGIEYDHEDLAPNIDQVNDRNWNDGGASSGVVRSGADSHGTSCAGLAAGRGNNGLGAAGVAYEARLTSLRLTAGSPSDADEAQAIRHAPNVIGIKSNSWGPDDSEVDTLGPGPLTEVALEEVCEEGRNGKGTILVWAGGNGRDGGDDVNFDGYANSIHTIAVGSVTDRGKQAWYSESGSPLVVVAPSGGGFQALTTADLPGDQGSNPGSDADSDLEDRDYTNSFGGTSASTPIVAGACALLLEANPNLGWRDVQEILIRSARQVDPGDSDWAVNGGGLAFNHRYGAGMLDVGAAIDLAEDWGLLGAQQTQMGTFSDLSAAIPDDDDGLERTVSFSQSEALRVEHVRVKIRINHGRRGDLQILLRSPLGMESRLVDFHDSVRNHYDWTFTSVRHWGEISTGAWTLVVTDGSEGKAGTLVSAELELLGTTVGEGSGPPIFSSRDQAVGFAGSPFSYQMVTFPFATSYRAEGLPPGLSLDPGTGLISGMPVDGGTHGVTLFAGNEAGETSFTLTLNLAPPPSGDAFADGLDWTDLGYLSTGDAPWVVDNQVHSDGIDSLRSGSISDDQVSRFQTTVEGPALIRFRWKASTETNFDVLSFRAGGGLRARLSGDRDWEDHFLHVGEGTHPLTWIYRKDAALAGGEDAVWIDRLVVEEPDTSLGPAVDMQELVFSQWGDALWVNQQETTRDGSDAARSTDMQDDKKLFLETSLPGPGQVSYQVKVSTEAEFDPFVFLL